MLLREARHRLGLEDCVVAIIEEHADADGAADGVEMTIETFLLDVQQIWRQDEDAVGAGLLGGARELDRHRRAVAHAADHRHAAFHFGDRGGNDLGIFIERQREELARAAGRKQGDRAVGDIAFEAGAIRAFVERQIVAEMRDRKGQ